MILNKQNRWAKFLTKRGFIWRFARWQNNDKTFIILDDETSKEYPVFFHDKARKRKVNYIEIGCSMSNLKALRDYYINNHKVELIYLDSSVCIRKKYNINEEGNFNPILEGGMAYG